MRALIALMMRGRTQAMTASAVFAALSLLFPPLTYASGAVIGLATLKQGAREGALVIGGSLLLCGAFALLMAGTPAPALAFLGMSWLPVWVLAVVLATTRSQGAAVGCAAVLGAAAVLVLHVGLDDPTAWWRQVMEEFFAPALQAGAGGTDATARFSEVLDGWAPRMTRFFGAATATGLVLTLFLARWSHALLDNPGGFGREFRELRVGRPALIAALVIGVCALFVGGRVGEIAADLMGPVTAMLLFQGLAVVHAIVRERKGSAGWLVATYLLLVVPPHLALPALTLAGLVDGWVDFRARVRAS